MEARLWILLGALNAALSVMLGAFGAHALKASLTADMLTVYQTAHQYHIHHALGLLLIGGLAFAGLRSRWLTAAGVLLLLGIVLFSGSLYALSITGMRSLGIITPFGGMCFILGWFSLLVAAWRMHAMPRRE